MIIFSINLFIHQLYFFLKFKILFQVITLILALILFPNVFLMLVRLI